MKKIITIITLIFLITSCGGSDIIVEQSKKDFIIETKSFGDFSNETFLKKTGKVNSTQDLTISSQATGRVRLINVKEGQNVIAGQKLAILEDNIANYGINLSRARNSLERAKINYETTENGLNKSISDISINVKNLKIDESNSSSSLELEKINNTVIKLDIDFDNLQVSNTQTINGFYLSVEKDFGVFEKYLIDVIDFIDKQFGYTNLNKDANDLFEDYLGAKNRNQKDSTRNLLIDLINYKEILDGLQIINKGENADLGFYINKITIGYDKIDKLLSEFEITLDNSISSIGNLSVSDIATKRATVNGYQTNLNMNNGAFIGLKNSINTFLETYLRKEESLLKQIELLESDKRIYIKSLDTKLEIDESTLNETYKNKELTLKSLKNNINDAQIGYNQAYKEYGKLTIKSPINGIIGNVGIDIGQEISNGYKAFTVSNISNNEINISFNKKELDLIKQGQEVIVEFEGISHTGTLFSISKTADANLKYNSKVILNDEINFTGNIVSVQIPIKTDKILLPINIVKVNNSGIGTINILEDSEIEQLDLVLGTIYGDKIQIIDELDENIQIIMSYIDNFDAEKFILKIK